MLINHHHHHRHHHNQQVTCNQKLMTKMGFNQLIGFVLITFQLFNVTGLISRIVAYEVTPFTDQPFASLSYTAVVRGKAALPCHVTTSTPDDSVALILWYKDDALAPIYTLDARKGTLDQARTLTAPVLQGRAFFNLHNRPAFLKIEPVRLSDSGEYRCRVDFKKARTINTVISLKVIVPPEEPTITNLDEVNLKGLIGPFNEGDSLKIVCTTNGGKPRPSLTWWRDNSLIDDTFEYIDKEVTTNQLTILSLARHHLLSKLTCQAVNNNMTVPLATSITLELNLKPTEVHITQLSPILVASKEVTFECKTIGSRPKPNIYWLFDGKRHSTGVSGDQVVTSRITIQVNKSHNGAMLSCIAENPKILNSQITDQLSLDVQYKPEVKLDFGSPTLASPVIQEGNDVYFDCKIHSNPKPIKSVQWKFNGNQLSPKQGIIVSNQSLVLQKVSREQSGLYQCIVTNSQGIGLSNEINLKIRFAPVCLYGFILTYGLALHESAVLRCYVEANPEKVSFQWRFQDKPDPLSSSIQSKGKFSDLIYTVNSSDDYGVVHCIAKNDVGLQRSSCKFLIKPKVPPKFPYNCKIVNQSDDSLFISCIYTGNYSSSNNNAQLMGSNSLKSDGDDDADALTPSSVPILSTSTLSSFTTTTNTNTTATATTLTTSTSTSTATNSLTPSTSTKSFLSSSSSSSSSSPIMDGNISFQQSNSITIHPRTIYFAEVYTKSDQNLVSNVTNNKTPYYYFKDNKKKKYKNSNNHNDESNDGKNDGDGDDDDNNNNNDNKKIGSNGSADGLGRSGGQARSSIHFLPSSPELGETADPLEIIDSLSRPIEFFITSLEPSTVFSINIYAVNSYGRSPSLTLEGSTLRSAEKLVEKFDRVEGGLNDYGGGGGESSSGSSHSDVTNGETSGSSGGSKSKVSSSAATSVGLSIDEGVNLLRGIPLLLTLLIGGIITVCGTVFLGIVAIFRLRRNLSQSHGEGSTRSGKGPDMAHGGVLDRGGNDSESTNGHHQARESSATLGHHHKSPNRVAKVFNHGNDHDRHCEGDDQDDNCCCDGSLSDNRLLITGNVNLLNDVSQTQFCHPNYSTQTRQSNVHQLQHGFNNNTRFNTITRSGGGGGGIGQGVIGMVNDGNHFNLEKGPPDIIPSIGYSGGGNIEKQYLSYDYPDNVPPPSSANIVHYAELAFSGNEMPISGKSLVSSHHQVNTYPLSETGLNTTTPTSTSTTIANNNINNINNSNNNINANNNNCNVTNNNFNNNVHNSANNTVNYSGHHQDTTEYAKIEFHKTTRVNIIGTGSPKFESTV